MSSSPSQLSLHVGLLSYRALIAVEAVGGEEELPPVEGGETVPANAVHTNNIDGLLMFSISWPLLRPLASQTARQHFVSQDLSQWRCGVALH